MACSNQRQAEYPQRVCPPVKSEPCRVLSASVLEGTWVMASYELTPGMTPKSDHWFAEMQAFAFAKDGHFKHLILLGDYNTKDLLETISRPSPRHQTYEFKNGYLWIKHPERKPAPYYVLEFQQDRPQANVKKGDIAIWSILSESIPESRPNKISLLPESMISLYVKLLKKAS